MFDLLAQLIGKVEELLKLQKENLAEYFDRYVEPVYISAEAVYGDYLKLMEELKHRIERREAGIELIRFLEERRLEFLPQRIKLRSMILRMWQRTGELTPFEQGVLSLMKGVIEPFEDGRMWRIPGEKNPTRESRLRQESLGTHTILDMLYCFSPDVDLDYAQPRWLRIVNDQRRSVDDSWKQIVKAYAEMQQQLIPKVPDSKRKA